MADPTPPIDWIHVDDDVAVIHKPSGLLVHRGWGRDAVVAMTIVRDALERYVYPVHRLDRATSGVLVFALTREAARVLQGQFERGEVGKRYLALTRGITPEFGSIDHPLSRDRDSEPRPARTEFRRLGTFERYSLVEAAPQTGRRHQIRRHFKHLSHPLIGDVRYGKGEHNRLFRDRFGLHRLALHAQRLDFDHPRTGERLRFVVSPPADLADPMAQMGLAEAIRQSTESRGMLGGHVEPRR